MQIQSYRVQNFRSIVDSNWIPFSPDAITVFVGQNESGKTSLLEALWCSIGNGVIHPDDMRGNTLPIVELKVKVALDGLTEQLKSNGYSEREIEMVHDYFVSQKEEAVLQFAWKASQDSKDQMKAGWVLDVVDADLLANLAKLTSAEKASDTNATSEISEISEELKAKAKNRPAQILMLADGAADDELETQFDDSEEPGHETLKKEALERVDTPAHSSLTSTPVKLIEQAAARTPLTGSEIAYAIRQTLPSAILFKLDNGLLPDRVDIDVAAHRLLGDRSLAAVKNFFHLAEVSLDEVCAGNDRHTQSLLQKASRRINADFQEFWSQINGDGNKPSLQCTLGFHNHQTNPDKLGEPYLGFQINDGDLTLYPRQRSMGVRWFVSFYLQLKATEKRHAARIFLLDEPGANLHEKAQQDVLKLIDKLCQNPEIAVVYSTHSAHMLEQAHLHRVRVVQRDNSVEDAPTSVVDAQHLSAATRDALSPVITAIGLDLAQQTAVHKQHNVLIENRASFYYLQSIWQLLEPKTAYFIAASEMVSVPALSNLLTGWGIDFIVVLTQKPEAQKIYQQLKSELCANQEKLIKQKLLDCDDLYDIVDVFSANDFKKHILKDELADLRDKTNSAYLQSTQLSPLLLAYQFAQSVKIREFELKAFDATTQAKMRQLSDAIISKLH